MWKRAGLLALLAVIAAGSLALWPRSPEPTRFTRENFRRIQVGTSKAEVEAILGPAGDFSTGETVLGPGAWNSSEEVGSAISSVCGWIGMWQDDRAAVFVSADSTGNVVYACYSSLQRVDHGPLGNLLWRAKRQWQRWFSEYPVR